MNKEDLEQLKKDIDTITNMPDEEVKHVSETHTVTDLRLYQMSQERDGGRSWEKLKKIREMFKKE